MRRSENRYSSIRNRCLRHSLIIFYMLEKMNIEPRLSVSHFDVLCVHMPVKLWTREISTGHLEVKSTLTVILLG